MKIEKTTKTITTYAVDGQEYLTVEDAVKAFVHTSLRLAHFSDIVAAGVVSDWKQIRQILNEAASLEYGEVIDNYTQPYIDALAKATQQYIR